MEVLVDYPKVKDRHLSVKKGEKLFVLLISHSKLPDGQYLVEKEDGTSKPQKHISINCKANALES